MALERTSSGEIPVEKLLAQLRRAAEQDGVEDVDGLVAEFATYVRAQAPRLASRHSTQSVRRQCRRRPGSGGSKSTALLAVSAVVVLAFGATVSGAIPNPLLPASSTPPNTASATAERPTHDPGSDNPDPSTPSAGIATRASAAGPVGGQPDTAGADLISLFSTDPDALAVLAEQRSEAPTPAAPTPSAPGTPSPGAITDAVDAADGATTATTDPTDPSDPAPPSNPADATDAGAGVGTTTTTTTTTVTVTEPFSLGGSGPETLSPLTDEGDAG